MWLFNIILNKEKIANHDSDAPLIIFVIFVIVVACISVAGALVVLNIQP